MARRVEPRTRWRASFLAVAFAMALGSSAVAAEYTATLGVAQRVEYDDNITLSFLDARDVTGYTLTPSAGLEIRGERWELDTNAELDFAKFSASEVDSDDQRLDLRTGWRTERGRLQLDAAVVRDSTRTAELDAGVVEPTASRRVLSRVSPSWSRNVGDRNQIVVGANVQEVRFDSSAFNDYDYNGIDVTWTRILRPRTSMQLTAFGNRFESEVRGFQQSGIDDRATDSIGLEGGIVRQFTERLTGRVLLGVRDVDSDIVACLIPTSGDCSPLLTLTGETSDTGGVGTLALSYAGERLRYEVSARRSLSPSGIGLLLQRDEITGSVEYDFSERLTGFIDARVYFNEAAAEGDTGFDREVYRVLPHLRWRINRAWSLDAGVRYRTRTVEDRAADSKESANSLSAFVNLRYAMPPRRVF